MSLPPAIAPPVTAQSDDAGVRAAIERANSPAVWGEALRLGDPGPLASVWAGEALDYFASEVLGYRARDLRLVSTLVRLEFLVVVASDSRAVAATREEWRDWICSVDGTPRGARWALVRDQYELRWHAEQWWVYGVDIELEAGGFDWEPIQQYASDGQVACATVVE